MADSQRFQLPVAVTVRVQSRSGRVHVIAEPREDVEAIGHHITASNEDGGTVLQIRAGRGSKPLTVRCPAGSDVVVGTRSGGVQLEGRFGEVSVTTMSGAIEVETADQADLRTMAGDIAIATCTGKCRASTVSGQISGGSAGSVSASSMAGAIRFGHVAGDFRARSVGGAIEAACECDGNIKVKTVSGKVNLSLPRGTAPDASVRSMSGRVDYALPAGHDLRLDAMTILGLHPGHGRMTTAAPPAATSVRGTIVFTDIVGFTEFTALRGDGEALALLAAQESIVREELGPEARIVKDMGDGMMLWFEDACAAIEAALCMQERFEATTMESDAPLSVRIGVHAGQQTKRGADLVGHDVNVASRIMALAGSGEVLTSEATVQSISAPPSNLTFERLGPAVMKGIPDPVNLYRAERRLD